MKLSNEKMNRREEYNGRHFRNQSAATQSHNSWREQNTNKYDDGYNNSYSEFDHAKDRKQQRRAARAAQKQARINAHQQWVERCRANRAKLAEEKAKRTKATSSHSQPFALSSSSSQSALTTHKNKRHDVEKRNKNAQGSNKVRKVINNSSKCTTSRESKDISKKAEQTIKHDGNESKKSESTRKKEKYASNSKSTSKTAKRERTNSALSEQAYKVARKESNHEISSISSNDKASKEKNGKEILQKHKEESSVVIPVVVSEHVRRCVNKLTLSNLTHVIHIICALFGDINNSATSVNASDEIDTVEEMNGDDKKRKMKSAQIRSNKINRNDLKITAGSVGENDSDSSQRELQEIRHLPHAPRAIVMASLAEQIIKFCAIDTGLLTPINTLPMAGVVRGLQVMYGNLVGGELIEKLARALQIYIFESNESAASNIGMIFAQLYLIYSVDATFIISLLQFLTLTTDDTSGDDHSDNVCEVSNKNEIHTNALGCAVAVLRICGDKLIKEAGNGLESLLQQVRERHTQWCQTTHSASTTQITSNDVTVRNTDTNTNFTKGSSLLEEEEQQQEQETKSINHNNTSTDEDANTITSIPHPKSLLPQKHNLISVQHFQNRCAAQISIMTDIASGMTRLHRKRNNTESDWSLDELLQQLCTLLPGAQEIMKKSASKRHDAFGTNALRKAEHLRSLRRIVQTMNTLSNIPFTAILRDCKPARWYESGVLLEFLEEKREQELHNTICEKEAQCTGGSECEANKSIDMNDHKECNLNRHDTFIGSANKSNINQNISNKSENGICVPQSPANIPTLQKGSLPTLTRKEEIHQMRTAERAIAGQRFNTEFKREVFQCVINASDDLDCFNALTSRDPSHARFADICVVLIQCCYQEEVYNTFYANVLSRFLSIKPAFRKTFQFALWDKFKSIRLDGVDVAGYLNLSCLITAFMERGTFTLSVLRGLDLNEVNKTIGLFTRIILLRMIMSLSSSRLTSIFFGGDGLHAHDVQIDTADFRRCLTTFVNHYFIDESVASRWLPLFYDIVATDTIFAKRSNEQNRTCADNKNKRKTNNGDDADGDNGKLALFMKRVQVAYKALKNGIM